MGDLPSFVIPNGLDLRSFGCDGQSRRAFREKWGIPAAAFVVTSVGRPDPIKRTSLLIEALARVPTGDTDWRALFVGPTDGAETRIWRKLIHDRGIADRVIWTGTLAGSDLLSAYAASDMLCSLSRDENFGMVVIEALACGLPVLATSSVGVWNEIAEEGVGETTTADPQDIAARIWSAMRSRETWSARGARGPFLVRERFSSSRVDSLMVRAFTDILTGQQSAEGRWANWPRRTSAQGS